MSSNGQAQASRPDLSRAEALRPDVVAVASDYPAGHVVQPHSHGRAQLIFASRGVMTVTTAAGAFVVPPQRAVWMPAGEVHQVESRGAYSMRTLLIRSGAAQGLPDRCCVVTVIPLLREVILAMMAGAQDYRPGGPEERLARVALDLIAELPVTPLHLPMPADPRLSRLAGALLADLSDGRGLEDWAREFALSGRTLARLFAAETGMSFRAWRQQARLLRALEMMAAGQPVTTVALDVGYDSPSAFIVMFRRVLGVSPARYFAS
jgi:AraC-like DNA-binding protein/quercetin dioxygenase-like cupin family protein